jgi:hypothetical protein
LMYLQFYFIFLKKNNRMGKREFTLVPQRSSRGIR